MQILCDARRLTPSLAVIRRGDYLGLVLLVPLDPGVTRTATLHVILEDAKHVLVDHGGAGTGQIRVEVSVDGYRWVRLSFPSFLPPSP